MSRAQVIGVSVLFASCGIAAVPAQAVTLSFSDLTDNTITLSRDGVKVKTVDENQTNSISITLRLDAAATKSVNNFFTLTEPASGDGTAGSVSDILQLSTAAGSQNYEITFTSDTANALPTPPRAPFGTTDEINGFITIKDVTGVLPKNTFRFPTDQPHPAGLVIEMASDVVPIPAALPLFATGLGALALLSWRWRRRAQTVG